MKVILYRDYPSLGEEGDVKNVADGYARNFLIPKKIAVRYTKATEMELAQKQQSIVRKKKQKIDAAADMQTRVENLEMTLAVPAGENGRLFGSVTSASIVDFLQSQGIEIERKRVELPEGGIKIVGQHNVVLRLYGGKNAILKVSVSAAGDAVAPTPVETKSRRTPQPVLEDDEDAEDSADPVFNGEYPEEE